MVVAVLLALGPAAAASPVTITVDANGSVAAEEALTIVVRRVSSAAEVAGGAELRVPAVPGRATSVELEDGHWALDVEGAAVWHARQYFSLPGAAAVVASIWPASTLRASVTRDAPRDASVRFAPHDGSATPSGESSCAMSDSGMICRVPAGVHALRVRAPGHITLYYSGVEARAGEVADLGRVAFRRGQSITGRVAFERGSKAAAHEVTITARPRRGGEMTELRAKAGTRGFFHIDGVAPGEYAVTATHPSRLASREVHVTVIDGAETELAAPLLVARPREISVAVTPPVAPDGSTWRVTLWRLLDDPHVEELASGATSDDGTWSAPRQQPGRYAIAIATANGCRWAYETFDLETDLTIPIVTSARGVKGRVFTGDRPLEGEIALTGEGGVSARARSDADGRFSMLVPEPRTKRARGEPWTLHITAAVPPIDRKVQYEELPEDEELVIRLASGALTGRTVDERQRPVTAIVNVVSNARLTDDVEFAQRTTGDDGRFDLHGLAPGDYRLIAESEEGMSEPVVVTLKEADATVEVILVVRPQKRISGVVVSPLGPVPGASVWVHPTDADAVFTLTQTTDARGRFVARVPPNANAFDVHVAAPGFAFTMGHLGGIRHTVVAEVQQNGGTLTVDAPADAVLRYGGASVDLDTLRHRWHTIQNDDGTLAVQAMEPGVYSLCSGSRCTSGLLPPHGQLALTLPK